MPGTLKIFTFLLVLVSLASWSPLAAGPSSPCSYEVRKGDYLGLIAQKFGVTVGQLRTTNKLDSDLLRIGQEITIDDPFQRSVGEIIRWSPPCRLSGDILRPFGPYKRKGIIMPSTGTDVACAVGTAVSAPATGVVRHVGPMDGFGTLLILEHGGGFATVFSPFDPATIAVEVGQAVLAGDHLGRTGPPPDKDTPPYVHIELRKNDKAIEPDPLLR